MQPRERVAVEESSHEREQRRADLVSAILRSLRAPREHALPFRHWRIDRLLEEATVERLRSLPASAPEAYDASGARSSAKGLFFTQAVCDVFDVCGDLVRCFADRHVVSALESLLGARLSETLIRIGYHVDVQGFWLAPHRDLAVKRLTLIVYLSEGVAAETLGTDLFRADLHPIPAVPARAGSALLFVPGADTWHGFVRRTFSGLRRTLTVNFVTDEWTDRAELSSVRPSPAALADSPEPARHEVEP